MLAKWKCSWADERKNAIVDVENCSMRNDYGKGDNKISAHDMCWNHHWFPSINSVAFHVVGPKGSLAIAICSCMIWRIYGCLSFGPIVSGAAAKTQWCFIMNWMEMGAFNMVYWPMLSFSWASVINCRPFIHYRSTGSPHSASVSVFCAFFRRHIRGH